MAPCCRESEYTVRDDHVLLFGVCCSTFGFVLGIDRSIASPTLSLPGVPLRVFLLFCCCRCGLCPLYTLYARSELIDLARPGASLVFFRREVKHTFTSVGTQAVSLSQTVVSTGNIKQIELSVVVKVRQPASTCRRQ